MMKIIATFIIATLVIGGIANWIMSNTEPMEREWTGFFVMWGIAFAFYGVFRLLSTDETDDELKSKT